MLKGELKDDELRRYARHLVIPEVGVEGQKKLKQSSVLIVGAGGLGSPIGMYLAAAGIGKIGLVDFDNVSYSNLQRQILFSDDDVGKSKAEIGRERLLKINPGIDVKAYSEKLTYKNAIDIIRGYDVVADGSDNFSAKYLVNDACVFLGKPLVYGSVLRFEGQVSVFHTKKGPCYRCLYPEPPAEGSVLSCEEAGVLGVLPGIIGSIQANEVIKLVIGKGELLIGRLLTLDALGMRFKEIKFEKNPDCPVCGKNPVLNEMNGETYDFEFCYDDGQSTEDARQNNISSWEITVEELKRKIDNKEKFSLIDVREPFETRISSIGGKLIPFNDIPNRIGELNKDDEIIIYCRTGNRSHYAVQYLRENAGFKKVKNLLGGINLWAEKIDNSLPKY
jgi:molybdopterin/thiamine biosynthesis adenylyltransferase/rhodanese-related sulfurtransferase